jgi:hypothetical protein
LTDTVTLAEQFALEDIMVAVEIGRGPADPFWRLDRAPAGLPSPNGHHSHPDTYRGLPSLVSKFEPIGLAEMKEVALMDRSDTKYVMCVQQLYTTLSALRDDYRVLEVAGTRVNHYRTVYFDTEDLAMYRQHHSDRRIRCKVRSREYVDTAESFLEVKWKGKRGRTVKERVQTEGLVTELEAGAAPAVATRVPLDPRSLVPTVANRFVRITLVSRSRGERVTLDTRLEFEGGGRSAALPGIAIAEVKQDGADRSSPFVRQMRAAGIRPIGFSKYCIGVALLYPEVKHNRFKPRLRLINSLMGDGDAAR